MRARFVSVFAVTALCLLPFVAHAAPPDDATKDEARKIAQEGLDLYDGGEYRLALDKFLRADTLVHAPTMLVMAARSLEKMGRLVEAADKFSAASQMILDAGASDAFRKAVADAAKERDALLTRIPTVVLTLDAPQGADVVVTLDGQPFAVSAVGQKQLIDPGDHTFEGSSGGVATKVQVTLKEGESRSVILHLQAAPSSPLRTVGFVAIGVGAAGVVMGAVTGGLAIAKNEELKGLCNPAMQCPVEQRSPLSEYDTLRSLSAVGLWAGGAVLAGGIGLLLFAPTPKDTAGADAMIRVLGPVKVTPIIGIGGASIHGVF